MFLFDGTLRENIAYGRLDATGEEILDAAATARLSEMIADLPAGLDTVVGERDVTPSGGQKQRVAIARIFLRNPPIRILDEATSALDTATERKIQASLAELSRGGTTPVIAHRLATVRDATRIALMEAGRSPRSAVTPNWSPAAGGKGRTQGLRRRAADRCAVLCAASEPAFALDTLVPALEEAMAGDGPVVTG